jgi:cell division protein FtsQ
MTTGGLARLRGILRIAAALALTAGVAVAVVEANGWKQRLKVATVRCEGNRIVPDADLLRLAAVPRGVRLFSVDLAAVQRRVRQNPYLRSAVARREIPGEIVLEVEERIPIAAIPAMPLVYVDGEGMILPAIASDVSFDLPLLTGLAGVPAPGTRLTDPAAAEALLVLTMARSIGDETYRRVSEVHAERGKEIVVYTADAAVPVVFGRGETAEKLAKFEAFWTAIVPQRDVQQLQYVDLRFRNQVVARWAQN